MKCPKTLHSESVVGATEQWVYEDCLKEECAWWDNEYNLCSLNRLSAGVTEMVALINAMEVKMPHEGQFRR